MDKLSIILTVALLFLCSCENQPSRNEIQETGYYTKSDLTKISARHPNTQLPQSLQDFLTDPNFVYDKAKHFDLGLENEMGFVFYLTPQNDAEDLEFLRSLEQEFPAEIKAMRSDSQLAHPSFPHPFSLTSTTRFANNNIASFLGSCAGRPERTKIMRKILFYLLTK